MNKINIFTDSIIIDSLHNPDMDFEILKELNSSEMKNNTMHYSNVGGFQTDTINNEKINFCILKKSAEEIVRNYKLNEKTKIELRNLWINKNYKNNYNNPHLHPDSNFSGIYYLQTVENGGELIFYKNDKSTIFTGNLKYIEDIDFRHAYVIKPKRNMFIIFPSNIEHMVTPNYEEKPRISISFNIGLLNG